MYAWVLWAAAATTGSPDVEFLAGIAQNRASVHPNWQAAASYHAYAARLAVLNADVPEFGYDRPLKHALWVFQCWDTLDDACRKCDYCLDPAADLGRLRNLIGEANYRQGLMPLITPVPKVNHR